MKVKVTTVVVLKPEVVADKIRPTNEQLAYVCHVHLIGTAEHCCICIRACVERSLTCVRPPIWGSFA